MEFVVKPHNRIEYKTRAKLLKCDYIVKDISVRITSNDPEDLRILMMHRKHIEKAIVDYLNTRSAKLKNKIEEEE